VDLKALRRANPYKDVTLREEKTTTGARGIRILAELPGSADVTHHPFQGEIDELVDCVLADRPTHIDVNDAQKTMELCIAADRSAERGGQRVRLPLLRS
jgi:predicted dehydrogenase